MFKLSLKSVRFDLSNHAWRFTTFILVFCLIVEQPVAFGAAADDDDPSLPTVVMPWAGPTIDSFVSQPLDPNALPAFPDQLGSPSNASAASSANPRPGAFSNPPAFVLRDPAPTPQPFSPVDFKIKASAARKVLSYLNVFNKTGGEGFADWLHKDHVANASLKSGVEKDLFNRVSMEAIHQFLATPAGQKYISYISKSKKEQNAYNSLVMYMKFFSIQFAPNDGALVQRLDYYIRFYMDAGFSQSDAQLRSMNGDIARACNAYKREMGSKTNFKYKSVADIYMEVIKVRTAPKIIPQPDPKSHPDVLKRAAKLAAEAKKHPLDPESLAVAHIMLRMLSMADPTAYKAMMQQLPVRVQPLTSGNLLLKTFEKGSDIMMSTEKNGAVFYAAQGAIGFLKCGFNNPSHPEVCIDNIRELRDAASFQEPFFSFMAFLAASHLMGVVSNPLLGLNNMPSIAAQLMMSSSKQTWFKLSIGFRRLIAESLGMAAGVFAQRLFDSFLRDPDTDNLRYLFVKTTKHEDLILKKSLENLKQKFASDDAIAGYIGSGMAIGLTSLVSRTGVHVLKKGVATAAALSTDAEAVAMVLGKDISFQLLRTAGEWSIKAVTSEFGGFLLFFGAQDLVTNRYIKPPIDKLEVGAKLKVADSHLLDGVLGFFPKGDRNKLRTILFDSASDKEGKWSINDQRRGFKNALYLTDQQFEPPVLNVKNLDKFNKVLEERYKAGQQWRTTMSNEYHAGVGEWSNYLARFLSDSQSILEFYANFIKNKDLIGRLIRENYRPTFNAINEGLMDWSYADISENDMQNLLKAKEFGLNENLVILMLARDLNRIDTFAHLAYFKRIQEVYAKKLQPNYSLAQLINRLESLPSFERRLRVQALNLMVPFELAINPSGKNDLQEREALETFLAAKENEPTAQGLFKYPSLGIKLIADASSRDFSKKIPFTNIEIIRWNLPYKNMLYSTATERFLIGMACGPVPANGDKLWWQVPKFWQPILNPPSIVRSRPNFCGSWRSLEFLPTRPAKDAPVPWLPWIAQNLLFDNVESFKIWYRYAVVNELNSTTEVFSQRKQEMTDSNLKPVWQSQELAKPDDSWAPEKTKRGESVIDYIQTELGKIIINSPFSEAGEINWQYASEKDLADPELLRYAVPIGIYRSLVSDMDTAIREIYLLAGSKDSAQRLELRKLLNELFTISIIKSTSIDDIALKYHQRIIDEKKDAYIRHEKPETFADSMKLLAGPDWQEELASVEKGWASSPYTRKEWIHLMLMSGIQSFFENSFGKDSANVQYLKIALTNLNILRNEMTEFEFNLIGESAK